MIENKILNFNVLFCKNGVGSIDPPRSGRKLSKPVCMEVSGAVVDGGSGGLFSLAAASSKNP